MHSGRSTKEERREEPGSHREEGEEGQDIALERMQWLCGCLRLMLSARCIAGGRRLGRTRRSETVRGGCWVVGCAPAHLNAPVQTLYILDIIYTRLYGQNWVISSTDGPAVPIEGTPGLGRPEVWPGEGTPERQFRIFAHRSQSFHEHAISVSTHTSVGGQPQCGPCRGAQGPRHPQVAWPEITPLAVVCSRRGSSHCAREEEEGWEEGRGWRWG